MESNINEIKSEESYISNQNTLSSVQKVSFDKSLKTMWHLQKCKMTPACFIYLSLAICSHITTIARIECVLVHSVWVPHLV